MGDFNSTLSSAGRLKPTSSPGRRVGRWCCCTATVWGDYAMFPWALRLAEDGWRCVLVDLRGHGKSTGSQITFGIHETRDLSQLLDRLEEDGELARPVSAVGVSYGASLALRWKAADKRVGPAVAVAPYGVLSNAVMNVCREYAPWLPRWFP